MEVAERVGEDEKKGRGRVRVEVEAGVIAHSQCVPSHRLYHPSVRTVLFGRSRVRMTGLQEVEEEAGEEADGLPVLLVMHQNLRVTT